MIIAAPGSRSEGLTIKQFPVTIAIGIVQRGIILKISVSQVAFDVRSRYSRREVEWSNARADAQRQPTRLGVHVLADLEFVPEERGSDAARGLDHLEPAQYVTVGI